MQVSCLLKRLFIPPLDGGNCILDKYAFQPHLKGAEGVPYEHPI
jgi:hypothetical protein